MTVPQSLIGRVIGKGGETIQRIQRESGAKLDVDTKQDPCTVRIIGDSEPVCHARFLISEILEKGGLRIDSNASLPPPPGSGYWPESGFAFGGPPPGFAEAWGGGGAAGGHGWSPPAQMSVSNEVDMDE